MSLKPNSKRLEAAAPDRPPADVSDARQDDAAALERTALGLLARREHSRRELHRKLLARGHALEQVETLLDGLQAQQLQSDDRFVETYVRSRGQRGYGPQRIRAELRERGIADTEIEQALRATELDWTVVLRDVWQKKYQGQAPQDLRERARQLRFLQQRGFEPESIRLLFGDTD